MTPENVYILAGEGASANIILGVYTSRELAEEAAEKEWPLTDGYHDFVITEYEIDPAKVVGYLGRTGVSTSKPLTLEYR